MFANNWGHYLIMTATPTYLHDIHHVNLKAVRAILR